jgi:lipoyl(octanoyl) transferase
LVKPCEQIAKQHDNNTLKNANRKQVDWCRYKAPLPFENTLRHMEHHVAELHAGRENEQVWLLEHPPLYTAGTSARHRDLLSPARFPVFETGRGGQYTYHGPGQRICYVMLDLNRRGRDVRKLVTSMEHWVIGALDEFGIKGETRADRVGVWVARPDKPPVNGHMCEDKIAAIGIRVRRWVSFHGLSLNVTPDLEHYSGIVPCGISGEKSGHGVTSFRDLGIDASMDEVDDVLKTTFVKIFDTPVKEIETT